MEPVPKALEELQKCGARVSGRSERTGTDWDATHGKSNGEENGGSPALTFSTPIVSTIRIIMLTRRTSLAMICGEATGRGEAKRRCVSARRYLYIISQASEQHGWEVV